MKGNSKSHRVTLEDIAAKVGVTKMTISRYLKNPDKVAKETQKLIQAAIEETGYVPNRVPVMLAQSSTQTIGLAVSSFSNLLFSDLIDSVEHQANKYGYEVMITHTSYLKDKEERKIMQLLSYQVDAIILTEPEHTDLSITRMLKANIPIVELMSIPKNPLDMTIGYNHEKIAYVAARGLIESGRKKIAYFSARMDHRTLARQSGYEIACKEHGLPCYVLGSEHPSTFSCGADMMRKAIEQIKDLDAVICTNDDVAIGAMLACSELGIKVPEQISILGYNGLNIGTSTIPKLTSVYTARSEMGKMAVDMIIRKLNNEKNTESMVELYPMLTLGQTLTEDAHRRISRYFDTLYAIRVPEKYRSK